MSCAHNPYPYTTAALTPNIKYMSIQRINDDIQIITPYYAYVYQRAIELDHPTRPLRSASTTTLVHDRNIPIT